MRNRCERRYRPPTDRENAVVRQVGLFALFSIIFSFFADVNAKKPPKTFRKRFCVFERAFFVLCSGISGVDICAPVRLYRDDFLMEAPVGPDGNSTCISPFR